MDKAAKMKEEIAKILDLQPDSLIYQQRSGKDGKRILDLTTISPNPHRTKFLFHTATADTDEQALEEMYRYVNGNMRQQDTFQIRWHNPKTRQIEISWFRASNILEALDKFYHDGKEVAEYKIYEVSLRPYA